MKTANGELSVKKGRRLPSEFVFSGVPLRRGATWPWQLLMCGALGLCAVGVGLIVGDVLQWFTHRIEVLIVFAGIGCWRWSWFGLQALRAMLYRYWMFPRLRRQAERAEREHGPVPEVTILAVTYKEEPWI